MVGLTVISLAPPSPASQIAQQILLIAGVLTLLAAIIYAIWFTFILLRDSSRSRQGRCMKCGYDLRHCKDRCPECGRAIPTRPNTNHP